MARGVSNRWPPPPVGFLTTKGVIERGQRLKAAGQIQYAMTQPQVLLTVLGWPPAAKQLAGFPTNSAGSPLGVGDLRRGPGPRGGRFEWSEPQADAVLHWWDTRQQEAARAHHRPSRDHRTQSGSDG